jgi:hypothetical protein
MLDQSLLKSHFIGRDGFRWWIGQIAPIDAWKQQVEGGGWSYRYKVRILGYHPYSVAELSNEDLPWAQALLPTTAGTGSANCTTGVQLQPGDVVVGFFLDGDDAQIPVILAAFANTTQRPDTLYTSPFVPFTGFNEFIEKNNKTTPSQASQPTSDAQRSPADLTDEQAKKLSQQVGQQVVPTNSAIGDVVHLANTVRNKQIDKIQGTVRNLLKKIGKFQGDADKIKDEIDKVVDKIVSYCNEFIGGLFDSLTVKLLEILKKGLNLLYKLVYAQVLAATGNPAAAHLAGVAAQQAMVIPVKKLEEAFSCIAGSVIDNLKSAVADILNSVVSNVDRFVTCAAEQFTGSLLNTIIDTIEVFVEGPLEGVQKLLQFFSDFNVGNMLRDGIGLLTDLGVTFACNQNTDNFRGLVNNWVLGYGPASDSKAAYDIVQEMTNYIASGQALNNIVECFTDALDFASPPTINIFGGLGSGATAVPIFGNVTTDSSGNTTASVIGVQVTNPGSGYKYPPFIEIVDDADQGYGAVARTKIKNGQVSSIYMVSEGENYSVGDISQYSVLDVFVENGGGGYEDAIVTDNLGNTYNSQIVDGRIYQVEPLNNVVDSFPTLKVTSNTGTGAILRPLLGDPKFTGEVETVVNCVV